MIGSGFYKDAAPTALATRPDVPTAGPQARPGDIFRSQGRIKMRLEQRLGVILSVALCNRWVVNALRMVIQADSPRCGCIRRLPAYFPTFPEMQKGENTDASAPAAVSEPPVRRWVCWFSLLGAVHVLVFSAAFPFFNNLGEIPHFDLVVKYAHGHFLRGWSQSAGNLPSTCWPSIRRNTSTLWNPVWPHRSGGTR